MPSKVISFTNAKNVPGDGPFVIESIEKDEKRISTITFANPDGSTAFRMKYQDYGVKVQVPTPPTMVKRTRITATNDAVKITITEDFEDSYSTTVRKNELERNGFTVTTSEVEIPEPNA